MHRKEYRINTRTSSGDTFVFDKQLLVSVPGHGCDDCYLKNKPCTGSPMCSVGGGVGVVFQPASNESDLFLTLRLKGEI